MVSKFTRSPIGILSSLLFLFLVGLFLMPGCGTVIPTPTPTPTETPSPTPTPTATPTPTPIPVLFVTNLTTASVLSFPTPATTNGNTAPATNLSGGATLMNTPQDVVVLSNGEMVVCNTATRVLTVYPNARTANGNLAPTRNVQGLATLLLGPAAMTYDSTRDLLYVSNQGTNQILVFTGVSTSAFNGNLAPARVIATITGTPIAGPMGLFIDAASDTLYLANHGANNILVYSSASTRSGADVPPARVITSLTLLGPVDLLVDSGDNLIVPRIGGAVLIFTNASTRTGNITPDFTFTVGGAVFSSIAVDAAGNGYLPDQGANAVYSINNIATRNGIITPDRTIQGAATQLSGAFGVFISQ